MELRRGVGSSAGTLAVVHTIIGQNPQLRGQPRLYYVHLHAAAITIQALRLRRFFISQNRDLGHARRTV
jgi:hypothetical protein